jgi:hypothetical protein
LIAMEGLDFLAPHNGSLPVLPRWFWVIGWIWPGIPLQEPELYFLRFLDSDNKSKLRVQRGRVVS